LVVVLTKHFRQSGAKIYSMTSKIAPKVRAASQTTDRLRRTARFAWTSTRRGWVARDGDLKLTAIASAAA